MVIDAPWSSNTLSRPTFGWNPNSSNAFSTSTSNAFPSTARASGFVPASTPGNNNMFGINSFTDTKLKPGTGSRLAPYSATRVPDERFVEIFQSISAMPVYEAQSHDELRWEDYESLPNNKCSGFKNCDTIRSPFESFKPDNNLFGPPSNNTTSSTNSTFWPSPSPFSQNPTQTQAFNTTFQLVKPNNNPFGPTNNNTSPVQYPNPSQPQPFYTQPNPFSKNCDTLRSPFEVFKPNNNLFGPSSTFFPSPSPFSQTQAFNNNNPFGQTNNNTSPVPNIFSQNNNQTQAFNVSGSKLGPYLASRVPDERCAEIFQSISAMPVYEAKSHEELRLEDYELLPNKGDGFKNFDTQRSPFEPVKPNNNPFGLPNNNTTSSTNSTLFPSPSPLSGNSTFQPVKPNNNNNPFGLPSNNTTSSTNSTFFPSPSPFSGNTTFQPVKPNNNPFAPTNNTSPFSIPLSPFEPIKPNNNNNNNMFPPTNNNTTPLFPSPFSLPNPNPSPSQPQPFNTKPNPFLSFPPNGPTNTCNQFPPAIPTAFTNSKLTSTVSPFTQSTTSVSALGPWSSITNTLQPAQTAGIMGSVFINNPSQPSQASIGLKVANEVGHPYINGQQQQQYVPASTVSAQSSLAVDPFPTRSEIDRPNAAVLTSVQHGISSLPAVPNKLSSNRSTSLMRIRHVSSRLNSLQPHQRYTTPSSEPKVAFFHNEVDRPGPFLPRENPRAWVTNSLPSLQSSSDGKCCEDRDLPSSSFQLNTHIQEETEHLSATSISHQNDDDDSVIIAKKHEASVLSLMPKLPNGNGYYTKPLLNELAAKEMDEPGSLSRVNDFVVGKSGYGSIKFLGETDIRHLDLGSVVQFNNREVIVYADEKTKPAVGKGVNKPAEVTLLNVKCVSNKTGKQYVDGPQVQSYKEMLMKKALEQGAEHVSYDPVRGEWKFRVQHF